MPIMWNERRLPRLERHVYQGQACVFWTHTIKDRKTGWLDPYFHHAFRERLLHAQSRFHIACPAYVIMPDHFHILWMGAHKRSDQLAACRQLRKSLKDVLTTALLQKQAYDHVLRDEERDRDALCGICHYIRENPVRAGLVEQQKEWPYQGALIPGYPDLKEGSQEFWDTFWKCWKAYQEGLAKSLAV